MADPNGAATPDPIHTDAPGGDGADALLGWLVVAPFAFLAWPGPGGLFSGAPDTVSIGIGATALGALPAVLLATLRGRGAALVGLPLLVIVLAFAAFQTTRADDSFNAWRALVGIAAALGWTIVGASLGPYGRRVVARGLPLVTILLVAATPWTPEWAGVFGNTGDLSEAALPGAVLGAGVVCSAAGGLRALGLAALVLFGVYVGATPVHAGLASLGVAALAAGCAALVGRAGGEEGRSEAARRFRILLVGVAAGLVPLLVGGWIGGDGEPEQPPAEPARTTTGGFEFRRLTWARVPAMVLDHAQLGVGPGQFQSAFPPYRDPAEIELSSFDRREPTPIEVEHAHSDWLTIPAEYGSFAGGLLLAVLVLALARAARQIAGPPQDLSGTRRDFALATIAVLANAAVNSPLLYAPASSLAAFVVLGVVLARDTRESEQGPYAYIVPGIALAALLLLSPIALSYVKYGRALADVPDARIVRDGREKLDPTAVASILDDAAAARPDSATLHELRFLALRRDEQRRALDPAEIDGPSEEQRATLNAWLGARPNSVAALVNGGALEVRAGRLDAARELFVRAQDLDPENPSILRNLVRLGCDRRAPGEVEDALDVLVASGAASPEFLREAALRTMLEGRLDVARPLVARWRAETGGGALDVGDANAVFAAQKALEDAGDGGAADALRNAFRLHIGQDHMANGAPEQAITQFRLAYQSARDAGADTAALRLHLAAAQAAAGRLEDAGKVLQQGPLRLQDLIGLTETERSELEGLDMGVTARIEAPR